jgi:short-subunit dehydrogenase
VAAPKSIQLAGSTALLTGATGGIGQAIARALAALGTRLILSGRRPDELERLANELGAVTITCDLGVRADVERLCTVAVESRVELLVANAALPASGLLVDLPQEDIDRMLDINLRAPITLARALAPEMVRRRRGHMVFISSLSGKATAPASSVYSATKFGLRGFALALREDLRPSGVGVSVVAPGFIREAGMYAKTGLTLPRGVGDRSPQDVAEAVITAVQRNRAELEVAPAGLRLGAAFASVAPGPASRASRVLGSHRIATDIAERQRDQT